MYAVKLLCVVKCFYEKLENQIFAAHPQLCAIYVAHSTKKVPPPLKRKKEMDILFYHDVYYQKNFISVSDLEFT